MSRTIDRPLSLLRSILATVGVALMAEPAMAGPPACQAPQYHQLDFSNFQSRYESERGGFGVGRLGLIN